MNEPHLINESCVEPSKAGIRDGAWAKPERHPLMFHEGQGKLAIDSRTQEYFDPLKLSQSVYVLLFQLQLPLLSSTISPHTTIFHPHSHHHQWLRVETHGGKMASILAAIVRIRLSSDNHKIRENIHFCSKV